MSKSNAQHLKATLYQDVEALVLPAGFLRQQGHGFRRNSPTGFQQIKFLVEDIGVHAPSFALNIHFSLRIHVVEELLQPYRAINPRYAHQTPTHVASIGQLVGDYRYRLLLPRPDDIDPVFDQVGQYITTLGLPYLETYQDIALLDQLYNETPHELAVRMKDLPVRALLSLGLAKLTNRANWRARATSLNQEFDRLEEKSREAEKAQFLSFVQDLFQPRLA